MAVCSFSFPEELTHLCCSLDPPPPTLNPQDERNGATQLMSGPLNPGTPGSPSSSESRICCARNHYTTCLRNRLEGEPGNPSGNLPTAPTHPPLKFHLHGQLCLAWETTTHSIPEPSLCSGMDPSLSSPSCLFLLRPFLQPYVSFLLFFLCFERLKSVRDSVSPAYPL
uniref:Uncharacterized protein n=1 Tax=Peromyscus maniculatus bairdii TaxID=230844 RepID=A0A8C8UM65_PERMB